MTNCAHTRAVLVVCYECSKKESVIYSAICTYRKKVERISTRKSYKNSTKQAMFEKTKLYAVWRNLFLHFERVPGSIYKLNELRNHMTWCGTYARRLAPVYVFVRRYMLIALVIRNANVPNLMISFGDC